MLFVICVITMLQAYVITWIIPSYAILATATVAASEVSKGVMYLLVLALILLLLAATILLMNRKKSKIGLTTLYPKAE